MNAAYARYLEVRRLLLIGRIDEAERALAELDPAPFPPASRTVYELVVAGIAMRRLQTKPAREALARAVRAARHARIPALTAEVDSAILVLNTPAARLICGYTESSKSSGCFSAIASNFNAASLGVRRPASQA